MTDVWTSNARHVCAQLQNGHVSVCHRAERTELSLFSPGKHWEKVDQRDMLYIGQMPWCRLCGMNDSQIIFGPVSAWHNFKMHTYLYATELIEQSYLSFHLENTGKGRAVDQRYMLGIGQMPSCHLCGMIDVQMRSELAPESRTEIDDCNMLHVILTHIGHYSSPF